jgi:hypothetical protein
MKNILVILVGLVVSLTTLNTTYGQLSKEEKKEWKQKYKAYKQDLEAFKNLVEENSTLKSQVNSSKGQVSSLQSRIADKDAQISDLQGQLSGMESQVNSAKAAQRRAEEAMAAKPAVAASGDWDKGIVFRVQIGAFAKASADAEGFAEGNDNFSSEKTGDMQKVTLGNFRDYWEADKFKKYLRNMGVKDAWIVPFKDGQRVEIKDVLEGVVE